jgi:Outer membrane lipoprotein-sorting protein
MCRWLLGPAVVALVVLLVSPGPIPGLALEPEEIVKRADAVRTPGESFIWDVKITNQEPGQGPTVHGYEVYVKGASKTFVKFLSPSREVGKSLLYLNRDLWAYLPDAGKPVRVPLSQRLIGRVANGDIARTSYSGDYRATLVGSETVGSSECYVLDLRATSKEVTYAAIKYRVAKETFHPLMAEFFAETGTLLKTGFFEDYKEFGGRQRPSRLTLVDGVRKDLKSTMDFSRLRVRQLPDKYFDKNYMKTLD